MPLFGKKKNKGPKSGPKNLRNKHLESTPQLLGGDSANEVYKTTYKDGKGISGSKTGYFKEDGPATIAKYAVGSSNLAQGLGLGDLVAETRYGKHDLVGSDGKKRKGVRGAVSKGAPGVALGDTVWDDDKTAVVQQARDQGLTEDDIQMAFSNMYKQRGDQWFANSGTEINEIDLSNPETQKGLNQLQWFDALIGNTDRHSGNILVDPATGKVVGIDNDLAFGKGHKAFDYEEEARREVPRPPVADRPGARRQAARARRQEAREAPQPQGHEEEGQVHRGRDQGHPRTPHAHPGQGEADDQGRTGGRQLGRLHLPGPDQRGPPRRT